MKIMKAMAFGTFDGIHKGHIHYLKKSKEHGNLTVVIARDLTVKKIKGKLPANSEIKRLNAIKNLGIADIVKLGYLGDYLRIIEENNPDILCLGYDQNSFTQKLSLKLKERGMMPEIIRISAYKPHVYKSSKLK